MKTIISIFCALCLSSVIHADDVINIPKMSLDLANKIAMETVKSCRKDGYSVAAVVVDRSGQIQVAVRDTYSAIQTIEIAHRKANAVIMAGIDSSDFVAARSGDIGRELNHINDMIMMVGGIRITGSGKYLGAIGVSGAPGGEKDEACAKKGIESQAETLEFLE